MKRDIEIYNIAPAGGAKIEHVQVRRGHVTHPLYASALGAKMLQERRRIGGQ